MWIRSQSNKYLDSDVFTFYEGIIELYENNDFVLNC